MAWLTQGLRSIESALERVDQQAASTLTTLTPLRTDKSDEPPARAVTPPMVHSPSLTSPARYTPSSASKKEVRHVY